MNLRIAVLPALLSLVLPTIGIASNTPQDGGLVQSGAHPGCEHVDAKSCVEQAIAAMGGRQRLEGIHSIRYEAFGHVVAAEQSYRQQPFVTSYTRDKVTIDFEKQRWTSDQQFVWPEADPNTESVASTLVATPQGAIRRDKQGDAPGSLTDLDTTRDILALSPERLLLQASAAGDLHFAAPQWLRATPHSVVEFNWQGTPMRVLLNAYNHLPDALERTRGFNDYWFAWGDVEQRIYFDDWHLVQGVLFSTNRIDQRNGLWLASTQLFNPVFNVGLDDKAFAMDSGAAAQSVQSPGWNRPFSDRQHVQLAPGIELYQGAWNTTLIKQDDGVLVLEAPISPGYVKGILAKVHHDYPGTPLKGVLSTSDSWPHIAGVRQAVAEGATVYALDLNRPLLDRLVEAPHHLKPDDLAMHPKPPHWVSVSDRLVLGEGANQAVLYPLRGASTERQYMVYFPRYKLLYASDTLALNPDDTLYDPELMYEVAQAVAREHLEVDTVYAMHQGPTPWAKVQQWLAQATAAAKPAG
ncbi:MBL fold metallo-hydrolase [Dyella choica]|uniref:MBL fold metallo-hydrolase n=1 Tax=Dyella choica TaxID=1927959 RepID=A0A3S0PIF4_9GAMM|nr:MBL fold metallo-hydrolase [Dyella choica]RUL75307.1 MBL fold metallo-hydrolase [Dyella choica]